MMRANELMVGDWVTFKDCQKGEIVKIKIFGIHNDEECCAKVDNSSQRLDLLDVSNLVGIPLTPEILEKNGFGYVEKDMLGADVLLVHFYPGEKHICTNTDFHIGTNGEIYWLNVNNNTIRNLMFVHQLQHALKLCGIEKEIIL